MRISFRLLSKVLNWTWTSHYYFMAVTAVNALGALDFSLTRKHEKIGGGQRPRGPFVRRDAGRAISEPRHVSDTSRSIRAI